MGLVGCIWQMMISSGAVIKCVIHSLCLQTKICIFPALILGLEDIASCTSLSVNIDDILG